MTRTKIALDGVLSDSQIFDCEQRLSSMNAVRAKINAETKTVDIEYDETKVSLADICEEISASAGVRVVPPSAAAPQKKKLGTAGQTAMTFLFSAAILALRILSYFGMGIPLVDGSPVLGAMAEIFLFVFVMYFGRRVYVNGVRALVKLRPDAKTVAALGTAAAAAYSLYALVMIIQGNPEYMKLMCIDACAVIISVVMLCSFFDKKSKGRTDEPIRRLYELLPKTATVILDDRETEVGLADITVGDSVLVKPMQSFPCDGVIQTGRTSVNEVLFTGENTPVLKSAGERVFAGTVNTTGFVTIEAERVGRDTSLARMIRSVRNLSVSKPKISGLVERAEIIYSVAVLAAAIIGFAIAMLVTKSFESASAVFISLMVVLCPCALGLVIPAASVYASAKATQAGIVFKDVETLENVRFIDTVVMDKTGTVTVGKLFVTDVVPLGTSEEEVLILAASVEDNSTHPIAQAILDYAAKNDVTPLECYDYRAVAGSGAMGVVDGENVAVMSAANALTGEYEGYMAVCDQLVKDGKTVMAVTKNGAPIGVIALRDKIKPTSKSGVSKLNRMGKKTIMLTGDSEEEANRVAKQLDFCDYEANVLPGKKADVITAIRKNGGKVAMVGDSVNDAVALAAADVGVAIGTGSPIAVELAQLVLVKNDLRDLSSAIRISGISSKIIKENIFWTFVLAAGVLPATVGIMHALHQPVVYPIYLAVCIAVSLVCVMLNSSRISRLDLTQDDPPAVKADKRLKKRAEKAGAKTNA